MDPTDEPVTDPSQVDPGVPDLATLPSTPDVGSTDVPRETPTEFLGKLGVSTSGITDAGLARVQRGVAGPLAARNEAGAADIRARGNVDAAAIARGYADMGHAATGRAEIEAKIHEENMRVLRESVDLQKRWADDDLKSGAIAKAEAAKYVGAYQQQKAAVAAMSVDPTGPIGSMSAGQAAGMGLAMFAQGFLAARGVHIDVSGQLDRWIDRSIQEQQRKIQAAGAQADDQLHLWEIARQTSHDDAEARTRYRGLVIQGLQTQLAVKAEQFGGQLAAADARAKAAELNIHATEAEAHIHDLTENRVLHSEQIKNQNAYQMGMLANERKKLDLEDKWRSGAGAPGLVPLYDMEPQLDQNGQIAKDANGRPTYAVVGYIDPKDKDAMKTARATEAEAKAVNAALDTLQSALDRAKAATHGVPVSAFFGKKEYPEVREYERARENVVAKMRHANTGAQFSQAETNFWEDQLPARNFWQVGNDASAIAQTRERVRQDYQSKVDTYGRMVPGVPTATVGRRGAADYNATMEGKAPLPTFSTTETETLTGDVRKATGTASGAFERFTRSPEGRGLGVYENGAELQPDPTIAVDHLFMGILEPEKLRRYAEAQIEGVGHLTGDNKKIAEDSAGLLDDIVEGRVNVSDDVRTYAKWGLAEIKKDPALFRKQLGK